MARVAKKELEALSAAVDYFEQEGLPLFVPLKSLLEKIGAAAKEVSEGGPSAAQIENCLVMYSAGKVVPMIATRPLFWMKQQARWKLLHVTIEQVKLVAQWLARQGWMASTTIDQVSWKWEQYLAKATAEGPVLRPGSRKEFDGE